MQLFLGVLLMMSLFMNESWVLGDAPDSSNDALYAILLLVFICFAAESVVLSFVQPQYFLGFFFWMDVMGTISILFDIGWVSDSLFGTGGSGNSGSILRATRAAKLGARYGRLMRILKLMKFIHLLPCFKKEDEDAPEPTLNAVRKVSNQLANVLSQRVAGLVMLFVIVLPFLNYERPFTDDSGSAWLRAIKVVAKDSTSTSAQCNSMYEKFYNFYDGTTAAKDAHLASLTVVSDNPNCDFSKVWKTVKRIDNLQTYSTSWEDANGNQLGIITASMDTTTPNQWEALYGVLIIMLVIFTLVFFSASFQNAVDSMLVIPLEKIMTSLRTSAAIMLKSMKVMDEEEEEDDDDGDGELETALLERMVEKLVKIVSAMAGKDKVDFGGDSNVDAATTKWLNDTYNTDNENTMQSSAGFEAAKQEKRIMSLGDVNLPVQTEELNSWNFDTLNFDQDQLSDIFIYLLDVINVFDDFNVPMSVAKSFLTDISGKYKDNTYHNYKHGYDVAHCVYRLVMIPGLNGVFSHLEFFSLLVAALGHDVGHPGVNNVYLVKAKNELAIRHNDRSPLENMHCSVIYEVLGKEETNIFVGLTDAQWRASRKVVLGAVLATDMSHHFEQISKVALFLEVNGEDTAAFCAGEKDTIDVLAEEKERMFMMEICLHCADISNPYKPFNICAKWADLVVEEFARQGEREASEGLEISPMMDRKTIQLCNMQMGFIEFVVAPLIIGFIKVLPSLYELGQNMSNNYKCWGEKRKLEIQMDATIANKEEESTKLDDRISKFKGRLDFCNEFQTRNHRASSTRNVLDSKASFQVLSK